MMINLFVCYRNFIYSFLILKVDESKILFLFEGATNLELTFCLSLYVGAGRKC